MPQGSHPLLEHRDGWTRPQPPAPRPVVECTRQVRQLGGLDSDVLSQTPGQLAARLGISDITARKWRRLKRIPQMWRRAVRALVCGDIGVIDDKFRGWRVVDGRLHSPDGGDFVFTLADVMWIPYARREITRLEHDVRRMREAASHALEEQQRAHDAELAELQVPTQADWLTGDFRPAPVPQYPATELSTIHDAGRYLRGRANYRERSEVGQ